MQLSLIEQPALSVQQVAQVAVAWGLVNPRTQSIGSQVVGLRLQRSTPGHYLSWSICSADLLQSIVCTGGLQALAGAQCIDLLPLQDC